MAERHGWAWLRYLRRNRPLLIGGILLMALVLFSGIGQLVLDTGNAEPLSAMPNLPPSWDALLGTDSQGRDLLTVLVIGTMLTGKIGLLAGGMGVAIGTVVRLGRFVRRRWCCVRPATC